jgi:hypothetical protein
MQVPAQPTLLVRALGDEIVAVIKQQAQIERLALERGGRQPIDAFAQRSTRDGERIDRVRLAALAR